MQMNICTSHACETCSYQAPKTFAPSAQPIGSKEQKISTQGNNNS